MITYRLIAIAILMLSTASNSKFQHQQKSEHNSFSGNQIRRRMPGSGRWNTERLQINSRMRTPCYLACGLGVQDFNGDIGHITTHGGKAFWLKYSDRCKKDVELRTQTAIDSLGLSPILKKQKQ